MHPDKSFEGLWHEKTAVEVAGKTFCVLEKAGVSIPKVLISWKGKSDG